MMSFGNSFPRIRFLVMYFFLLSPALSYLPVERDFKMKRITEFKVYWNIQSEICKRFKVPFEKTLKKYGIIYNKDDKFRGDQINLLYDPGLFPVVKEDKNHKTIIENGGIPQDGDLAKHLKKLEYDVDKFVDKDFSGKGVVDFEVWRPVFRQNWNQQVIYRVLSIEHTRKQNSTYVLKEAAQLAKVQFEESAKLFMAETLKTLKILRPYADWGYYGFPYCYNFRGPVMKPECPDLAVKENNETTWLFEESTNFYPSLYLSKKRDLNDNIEFMVGAFNEAFRVSQLVGFREIYPYISPYYLEDGLLPHDAMFYSLVVPAYYQTGGVILWARSSDVNNKDKCQTLLDYVDTVLGPLLRKFRQNRYIIDRCFEIPFRYTKNVATDHWYRLYKSFSEK